MRRLIAPIVGGLLAVTALSASPASAAPAQPCATSIKVTGEDPQRGHDLMFGDLKIPNRSSLLLLVEATYDESRCGFDQYAYGTATYQGKNGVTGTIQLFGWDPTSSGEVALHGGAYQPPVGQIKITKVDIGFTSGTETYTAPTKAGWATFTNRDKVQAWLSVPSAAGQWGDGGTAPGVEIEMKSLLSINKAGTEVTWPFKIVCPKGKPFTFYVRADQRLHPNYLDGADEDSGVPAVGTATGKCTGATQTVKMDLTVVPPPGFGFIPWVPPSASDRLQYSSLGVLDIGDPEPSSWCRFENCASGTDVPRVRLKG